MANVRLNLFSSKKLKNGTHPVMLVVTKDRVRKYYSMGYSCLPDEWLIDEEGSGKFRKSVPHASNKNKAIQKKVWLAEEIIAEFEAEDIDWTHTQFKDKFVGIKTRDVFEFFQERIDFLKKEGKVGTSNVNNDSRNALKNFVRRKNLRFNEITPSFLKKYESHLRSDKTHNGKSIKGVEDTTISVYMRTLRALINKAIEDEVCKPEYYPFKKYKISKLNHSTKKRAISKEDIHRIFQYEPDNNTKQLHSKYLFMFSYYARGMNFKDVALLKWTSIDKDRIKYKRIKTIHHKTSPIISFKINQPIQDILDHQRDYNKNNPYIFNILNETYNTPESKFLRLKSGLRTYNKHLKLFAKALGIGEHITSYVSRHSWASILRDKGASIDDISEGLGHSDLKTTKIYLKELGDDRLDALNDLL